ncbi:Zinc finger, RING/FYVE/PHD-type [Parasponia andersonii]|uniref:Zinc finger, RING/FYVE/PHD-type n=1 Tax=Parasponia andersonii TaxID=3476 RepID=A0A2P5AID4_PARAD|nr:Zinc finger, RING/FYVE/PHD-type [Parasponia andersonii]
MAAIEITNVVVLDVEEERGRRSSAVAGAGNGYSVTGGERSEEEHRSSSESRTEIVEKGSPVSECSVELDLECGELEPEVKVHLAKVERDCRICHLSLDTTNHESAIPFELGCSCKDDLAAAHKQCAEAWFKIKGNKTCEICGSTAVNVSGVSEAEVMEQWNESNDTATTTPAAPPVHPAETRNFWQGHRFLNFLLACMVFAFVISWLFHFNVPS